MANSRAASRYIKSLLGLAVEKGVLDQVNEDMQLLAKVCKENRSFTVLLRNPIVKHDTKRNILHKLFEGKVNTLTLAIFDILTLKNRESLLPAIATDFHAAYNTYKGIGKASVITAVPLDANLRAEFEQIVKKLSNQKQVELEELINPELIGGFVLTIGDKQIDASVKNKIEALKLNFSHNPFVKAL